MSSSLPGPRAARRGPSGAAPGNAAQALAAVRAGLAFLAAATDPADLTGAERADLLRGLCQAESQHLAARSAVLAAFDAADDHCADAQPTSRTWLRWQARTTSAAAGAAVAWARRLRGHPRVAAALAAGDISPSWARHIIDWTDRLPEHARDEADRILLQAAADGAELADLAAARRADPGPHRPPGP